MINMIALKVLGSGHTGFGPGPDGGRDGFFVGEAPYPSDTDRWKGIWYLQSKFHYFGGSKKPQQWIIDQVKAEIEQFKDPDSRRRWPDNWIIATNIDLSAAPNKGSYDKIKSLIKAARPKLANRFDIWGGEKILQFLGSHPEVARQYADLIIYIQPLALPPEKKPPLLSRS